MGTILKASGDPTLQSSGTQSKLLDPLGLVKPSPKKPKKTGQELATEKRLRRSLDDEIREQEERFRLLARGKLGTQSLLSGAPRTAAEAAGGASRSGGRGVGSLLPGIGVRGSGRVNTGRTTSRIR